MSSPDSGLDGYDVYGERMELALECIRLFTREFVPNFWMSVSCTRDIPFAWLWLPQDILTKHGYQPEAQIWLQLCGAGMLLSLLAGLLCLVTLPKEMPGKRTALLAMFWSLFLLDFAVGRTERPTVGTMLFALPSLLLCLSLLGWKTVALVRRRREHSNSMRAITAYSAGLFALTVSLIAVISFWMSMLSRAEPLGSGKWHNVALRLFPEIWLFPLCFPFDGISKVLACIDFLGGIWFCNLACVLLCWRRFGAWQDRRPAMLCLLWFVYVFHFSVAFLGGGYDVRSVLLVFLPGMAAIILTVFRLVEAIRSRRDPGRHGRILLLAFAIPSELSAFVLAFYCTSRNAFGASC